MIVDAKYYQALGFLSLFLPNGVTEDTAYLLGIVPTSFMADHLPAHEMWGACLKALEKFIAATPYRRLRLPKMGLDASPFSKEWRTTIIHPFKLDSEGHNFFRIGRAAADGYTLFEKN